MLGIYCRISGKKEEGKDVSIEVQRSKGINLAELLKINYKVYCDEGISGTLPIAERPAFQKLKNDIESNNITDVYVFDNSRLERNTEQRFRIIGLFKAFNIGLYTDSGKFDYNDPQIALYGNFESLFNSYFASQTKRKVKDALSKKIEKGEYRGGIYPFGYTVENKKLIVEPEEAETVKTIFSLSLSGKGYESIAKHLNQLDIKTRYARIGKGTYKNKNKHTKEVTTFKKSDSKWTGKAISGIIKNPIYYGEKKHRNTTIKAPKIVTRDYWEKVNDNLSVNRNNSGKNTFHQYLLKGHLVCGRCGRNYYGRINKSSQDNYYQCSSKRVTSCGSRSINIPKLDKFVWEQLFLNYDVLVQVRENYNDDHNEKTILENTAKIDSLDKENTGLKNKLSQLLDLKIDGRIANEVFNDKIKTIENQIATNETEIDFLKKAIDLTVEVKQRIKKYGNDFHKYTSITDYDKKREILNQFVNRIVIYHPPEEVRDKYGIIADNLIIIQINFSLELPPIEGFYTTKEVFRSSFEGSSNIFSKMLQENVTTPTPTSEIV